MPVEVTGPDGKTYHFPEGTDKAAAVAYFKKKGIGATDTISSPPTGMAALRAKMNTAVGKGADLVRENLPIIGATVGGLAGSVGGPVGTVGGAALGGAAGRSAQQLIDIPEGKRQPSSGAAAWDITKAGAEQGAYELGGMGIAKLASKIIPISRGARLSYAGGLSQGEKAIESLAPEFDKTLAATGSRTPNTVGEFANVIQATNTRLEQEFEQALFPVAQQNIRPLRVANEIRQKITPNMAKTAEGRQTIQLLQKKAREYETQDWTVGELNRERMTVAKRLRSYYKSGPSVGAAKAKIDADIMADTAQRDALNDMLYGLADKTSGKPPGYFKALKQKQSILTDLTDDITSHRERLVEGSAQKKGAPLLEKTHVYAYGHPTSSSLGSVGSTFTPSRFMDPAKQADRMVQAGFPGTVKKATNAARTGVGKAFSNATVDALPIRVMFADEPELDTTPPPKKSPGQQKRDLQEIQSKYSNPNLPVGP